MTKNNEIKRPHGTRIKKDKKKKNGQNNWLKNRRKIRRNMLPR